MPNPQVSAHRGFFPAAILCGLALIPLWAALFREVPELRLWHGHEMLLGYGFAVIAGFLLARLRLDILILLLGLWLLARIAVPLGAPLVGGLAALVFAALLAVLGAVRFLRAAKKGRNRMFAVILVGMALAEAIYQGGVFDVIQDGEQRGITLALDLLTLLMLQMGGRVIPAATAGALYRQGKFLASRVQPRMEIAIGGLMLIMIVADQIPPFEPLSGAAAVLVAAVALIRLLRWRGWKVIAIPDLIGLHIAYAWLVAGLALKGIAALTETTPPMAGIHALGVGALGTLTTVMMARTAATRGSPPRQISSWIIGVVALIGAAALLRVIAAFDGSLPLIWAAAFLWTLALLIFGALYIRISASAPAAAAPQP